VELQSYLGLVVGMGLVTFLPRWAPLYFLSNRQLPPWLIRWLDLIPVSILSALLAPALVTTGTSGHLCLWQPELLVAVPTFLFALKTRSLGGTVVIGMLLYWLSGRFM
jgi:branched-subunit amino acid transport protein